MSSAPPSQATSSPAVLTIDPARLVRQPLLPATADDRYYDYCLEAYRPRRPWMGKLRSENLFWDSVLVATGSAAEAEPVRAPIKAIQDSIGNDLTVWGVKWDGNRLFWELYFYDPKKEDPNATVTALARTMSPWVQLVPTVAETVPYMMASFDLSPDTMRAGRIDEVNLYLTGERHHAGRSYIVREDGTEFANTYRFFEAKRQSDEVLELVKSSFFVDYGDPRTLSKVLIPELFACKKICVSKKRWHDGIYYSGITVDQLRWFLQRFNYPAPLQAFVKQHEDKLDHLYFDVGIDYRMDATGQIVYPKTSYYGTL